ncbi:unnamed protein product [Victoria cruziana]
MAPAAVGSGDAGEGIRRGAWRKEEHKLLRKCVETYGEGNWHLVPHRTGLGRPHTPAPLLSLPVSSSAPFRDELLFGCCKLLVNG